MAAKTVQEVKSKLEERRMQEQREKEEEQTSESESEISMGQELEAILGKTTQEASDKEESSSEADENDGENEDEDEDGGEGSESEETQESQEQSEDDASVKESNTIKDKTMAIVPADPAEPAAGAMVRNSSSAYIDQVFLFPDSKPYIPYLPFRSFRPR